MIDFSKIDSVDKVKEEFRNGNLEKLYVISPMFGGADDESNILYVPIGIHILKEGYDDIIASLLREGKVYLKKLLLYGN